MSAQVHESRGGSDERPESRSSSGAGSSPVVRSSQPHESASLQTDLMDRPTALPERSLEEPPQPRRRRRRGPREMDPRPGHIHGLDGIRAIAIIGVLIFHFVPTALTGGFIGVDVFFVLSGFLITTLLLREVTRKGHIDLPQFWTRRARRLLPALVTVVVVSIAAARLVGGDLLVNIGRQTLGAMTFSTNWVEVGAGASYFHSTSPLLFINFWSLAVEEQFYLLWPLTLVVVLALTRTARQRIGVALGLAVASALAMALLFNPEVDSTRVYYGTDTHLFGLMLGVALAFAWAAPHRAGLTTVTWRRWRTPAVSVALVVLVGLMVFLSEATAWTFRGGLLLACLATVVLIAGLLESPSLWRTLMEIPPLRYLGERSYGIYLWHWPVLMIVSTLFPFAQGTIRGWLTLAGALALTLGLSELCFRFVETPVRKSGFRATLGSVRDHVFGPGAGNPLPKILAATTVGVVALAGVAIATAPDKSQTQTVIEAAEADLNAPTADSGVRRSVMGGAALGVASGGEQGSAKGGVAAEAKNGDRGGDRGGTAEGKDAGSGAEQDQGSAADGFADAVSGLAGSGIKDEAKDKGGEGKGEEDPQSETDPKDEASGETKGEPTDSDDATLPDGWCEDDHGMLVPESNTITAIGDSLVVTSADGLKWRFPEMNFAAKSNRQWKDANPVLDSALAQGIVRDNVIVHFGTNAGVNEQQLRTFLDALGPDRSVVVMNLYGTSTFIPESNGIIDEVVADYPNVVVGDWQGTIQKQPEVLQSDRVHPDMDGMHVYATVVAQSFDKLARG